MFFRPYLIHKLTDRLPLHEEIRHVVWYAIRDQTIKMRGIYEAFLAIHQGIEIGNQPVSGKVTSGGWNKVRVRIM